MANEMSVHRVSRSLLSFESPVTSNKNFDASSKGAEKAPLHAPESPPAEQVPSVSGAELRNAVDHLNELARSVRRELQFSVDEGTGRTVIKVIDSESEEVVREIPPEEILALIARFEDFNNGLIHEKA